MNQTDSRTSVNMNSRLICMLELIMNITEINLEIMCTKHMKKKYIYRFIYFFGKENYIYRSKE